jgi:CRP-like cAMP-binding protein
MPLLQERSATLRPPPRVPAWPAISGHPELRTDENARVQAGAWFAELSEPLRHAVVGHARVRQVAAGTVLAQRGDPPSHWFGVARGAVRIGTALADGRNFTLDFIGPSQWFGDIALIDDKPLELDVVAHAASTLLTVTRTDMKRLIHTHVELRDALLQLNCQRLRHMFHRFEELHTLPLGQRIARQVLRLARQFGRHSEQGLVIELGVSQGDLAALVGGSRQRVNRAWRQMHHLDIVRLGQARLLVLDEARLAAVAEGRLPLPGKSANED